MRDKDLLVNAVGFKSVSLIFAFVFYLVFIAKLSLFNSFQIGISSYVT